MTQFLLHDMDPGSDEEKGWNEALGQPDTNQLRECFESPGFLLRLDPSSTLNKLLILCASVSLSVR